MAAFRPRASTLNAELDEDESDLLKILQGNAVLNKEHILQAFRNEEVTSLEQLLGLRRAEDKSDMYKKLNINSVGEKIEMDNIMHDAQRKRIHSLMGKIRKGSSSAKSSLSQTNRQSRKRKVMLGWLHRKDRKLVQIRQKDGGGSRSATFNPSDDYDAILEKSISLFFPNGESSFGKIEDMHASLAKFNRETIEPVKDGVKFSVKGYQDDTNLSTLRIFLKTIPKSDMDSSSEDEFIDPFQPAEIIDVDTIPEEPNPAEPVRVEPVEPVHVESVEHTLVEPAINSLVTFGPHPPDPMDLDVTVPIESDLHVPQVRSVKVHRTTVMKDCIKQFNDKNIIEDHLVLTFIDERGVDGGGVSRDVYSSFWIELFNSSAEGCNQMVPFLRNDMGWKEWVAVGRVLSKGFLDYNFFPVYLCKAFILGCLIGPDNVSDSTLINSFVEYNSAEDRECLKKALSGFENMTEEENDDLLDILSRYHCRTLPRKDNISKVVATVAHKELLQKPKYIIDCFRQSCYYLKLKGIESEEDLESLYEKLNPTPKKVIKIITASPSNPGQTNSFEYLKQYVRGLERALLEKFLHFCTGSTVMCVEKIEVQFTQDSGFSRRPVAHTCGPVLQLPETYDSFPELKGEFNGILTSGVWEMHVV